MSSPRSSPQTRLREFLLLAGLCGFFFFFRLGGVGLLGPDEPRYAQVAREMLARHDWVTPVLYHHTWLEKPILLYWGQMLAYCAFGVSDWAARLPSAVAATALVFGSFLAVRRICYAARLDAALMIASSALILGFGRAAATDMLLASTWSLSLLAWFLWYQSRWCPSRRDRADEDRADEDCPALSAPRLSQDVSQDEAREQATQGDQTQAGEPAITGDRGRGLPVGRGRGWLYAFYALNALATLAKGPVAPALAALVLIVFCASQRRLRAVAATLDPAGLAVFFAIAAPWYLLVQWRTPEFFRVFFLQHNLARFGTNLYRHRQPFWYYLPVALAAMLPWTLWLFPGLSDAVRALRPPLGKRPLPEPASTFEIFLLVWALVPIVFFSLSRSKLPGYILPSVPALVILAAVAVHRREARGERPQRSIVAAHSLLLALLGAATCLAPHLLFKLPLSAATLIVAGLAGSAIFLLAALPLLTGGWRFLHFVTLLPVILIVGFLLRGLAPALDATQSARPIAELVEQIAPAGALPVATFALNRNAAFGLAFYLDRRVDPYEGLEISPAVYELPPAVPAAGHLLIAREGSLAALRLLLAGRTLQLLGSYPPQHVEIFLVSAVSASPAR